MIIDKEKCIGCGACVNECTMHSISLEEGKAQLKGSCINCSHCYCICPQKAISMEFSQVPTSGLSAFLYARKSVRHFKKALIPKEDLETLISRSSAYPSAMNQKMVEVTCVTNPDILKEIKLDVINNLKKKFKLINLPVFKDILKFVLGNNYNRIIRYEKLINNCTQENDLITFNAPCLIFIHGNKSKIYMDEDAHYVAYNLILTSMEMGYGSCFMGFVKGQMSKIMKEAIDIPSNHNIYSVIAMGYPDIKFERSAPQPLLKHNIIE